MKKLRNSKLISASVLLLAIVLHCMSLNKPVTVETKGSVAGEVRDFDTDEMLAGVSVATVPVTSTQSTDSSGHFSFSALQEATYIFKLSKAGYVSKAETAFVRASEELALTIRMQSTDTLAGIWGRVVDDISGEPVSAARISTVPVTRTVLTDSSGVFQIQDIPVGLVTVKVIKTDFDSAQVTFNATRRKTDSVTVSLHQLTPIIRVSKDLMEFGISGSIDSIMVSNAGIGTLVWAVQETLSWLTAFPESGEVAMMTGKIRVNVDRTNLEPGPHTGQLRVLSSYGNKTIYVSIMVPDPVNPAIYVSKSRLEFDSARTKDTVKILNAGTGQLTWTASKNAGWISLGILRDTIQTDTSVMVVTASAAGLAAGSYADTIAFNSNGGEAIVVISMAVKGATNLPPAFTSARANMDSVAAVGNLYRDTVTATDPNGDSLTYSVISGVTGMALANRVVTWLPSAGDTGTRSVSVQVIDGRGGADTLAWVIRVSAINRPPVFTSTASDMDSTVVVGATYRDTLYATDPDNDGLSYSSLSSITGMALTGGEVTWTPGLSDTGTKSVSLQVSDGKGGKDTLSWSIIVRDTNHAPVFSSIVSDMEDSAAVGVQYRDTAHARDPDGDSITFSFLSAPTGMSLTDSIITWMPTISDTGTRAISVRVRDKSGHFDTLSWAIQLPVPIPGLVAYYSFSGNANDASGNGNNGTVTGTTLTADRFGHANSAYAFDGIDDYIALPYSNLSITGNIAVALWAKTDTSGGYLFNFRQVYASYYYGVSLFHRWFLLGDGVSDNDTLPMPNLADNGWHFIVVAKEESLQKIYIDGMLYASRTFGQSIAYNSNWLYATLGVNFNRSAGPGHYYKGLMDDLRVYSRILSQNEIDSLYHEGGWTGSWSAKAPMPTPRSHLAADFGPDGKLYVVGGYNNTSSAVSTLEVFTPTSNSWIATTSMPTPRDYLAAAFGSSGKLYVVGGYNNADHDLNVLEVYQPLTNSWTTGVPMPTARTLHAAAFGPDGKLYVVGGYSHSSASVLNNLEVYEPATTTWTTKASMLTARSSLAASFGPDGKLYVVGGNVLEVYDPLNDSWSQKASMPTARSDLAASFGQDGKLYVVGGGSGSTYFSTLEVYNPATDSWTAKPSIPTKRGRLAASFGPDGKLYTIGGYDGSAYLSTLEVYTP